jgi:hypothetical protein
VRSVVVERYGDPSVLRLVEITTPNPRPTRSSFAYG